MKKSPGQTSQSVGFQCWNRFEKEVLKLKQLYDITAHLYSEEHNRIKELIPIRKKGKKGVASIHTKIGTITHSLDGLVDHTRTTYPNRLRELLLISLVTTLEVYLTSLAEEISCRDLTPFRLNKPIEFTQAHLLSIHSVESLRDTIIQREIRQLTSGGLLEIKKYFKTRFEIDFNSLQVSFTKISEIHERRHIHVHKNGVCDAQYANKYLEYGYSPGDKLEVSHRYLINCFNIIQKFAYALRSEALGKFPRYARKRRKVTGSLPSPSFTCDILLAQIEVLISSYDPIEQITFPRFSRHKEKRVYYKPEEKNE